MLFALALPAQAAAPPPPPATIVWMEREVPAAEVQARAARPVGGAVSHRAWADIAFEGQPWGPTDGSRQAALAQVMKDVPARWDEFEAEPALARALAAAVEPIEVLRDDAARAEVASALIWSGAAITRSYPDNLFGSLQDTVPFRVTVAQKGMVKPWVDAVALDPEHSFVRGDVPDAQALTRITALQADLKLLPRAHLEVAAPPPGVSVVADGRTLAGDASRVDLWPGHHYVHALVNGEVAGRQEFDIEPGATRAYNLVVSGEALTAAHAKVLEGSSEVPAEVVNAVKVLAGKQVPAQRVFLAALDERGRARVVGLLNGATIEKVQPFALLFTGELGGGIVQSDAFSDPDTGMLPAGKVVRAPAGTADIGLEFGIFNFMLRGGASVFLTPTAQMAYGVEGAANQDENGQTSVYFHPHGGVGVYLPRPTAGKPLFSLAGEYGWLAPSATGFGLSLTAGVPSGTDTWVRFTLGGFSGKQEAGWSPDGKQREAVAAMFRIGFGSLM
jgi:hypothetical protein